MRRRVQEEEEEEMIKSWLRGWGPAEERELRQLREMPGPEVENGSCPCPSNEAPGPQAH